MSLKLRDSNDYKYKAIIKNVKKKKRPFGRTCESPSSTSRKDVGCLCLAVVDCEIVVVVGGQLEVTVGFFFTVDEVEVETSLADLAKMSQAAR